jgi:hypothetical protein
MFLLSLPVLGVPAEEDHDVGVQFQVVPDKRVYAPGATMNVMFIVEHTGESPLYLFRNLSQCSSQMGSYYLAIRDQDNRIVNREGCSSDLLWDKVDVVHDLTDPKSGIQLRQYELFGRDGDFKLPAKKGTYRLEGSLLPTGFTGEQEAALSKAQMRVVQNRYPAPSVTIVIK